MVLSFDDDSVIAEAYGVPPPWAEGIGGAEAWALLMAATYAEPGTLFYGDCLPCLQAFWWGLPWASSESRSLARVYICMLHALRHTPRECVVWVPAHTSEHDVGAKFLSDGTLLTERDRDGNSRADTLAKFAVEEHRVPPGNSIPSCLT